MLEVLAYVMKGQTHHTCVEKDHELLFKRYVSGGALSPIMKALKQLIENFLVDTKLVANPFGVTS
jgi:hypothetical protein